MKQLTLAVVLVLSAHLAWADVCPRIPTKEVMEDMSVEEIRVTLDQYYGGMESARRADDRNQCSNEATRLLHLLWERESAEQKKRAAQSAPAASVSSPVPVPTPQPKEKGKGKND